MFPSQNYFLNGTNYTYAGVGNLGGISQCFLLPRMKSNESKSGVKAGQLNIKLSVPSVYNLIVLMIIFNCPVDFFGACNLLVLESILKNYILY